MTAVPRNTSTLAELRALYPGAILIDRLAVARALGISEHTIRTKGRKFPIPIVPVEGSVRYRIVDTAAYIDRDFGIEQASASIAEPPPAKRGPGRRTNREKAAKKKADKNGGAA